VRFGAFASFHCLSIGKGKIMPHIALLGDSVFDNGRYVPGEPDTCTRLRSLLPPAWKVTLCAVDGHTAADLAHQIPRVPADATHLALSLGGNDALGYTYLLDTPITHPAELLLPLADALDDFERDYRAALQNLLVLGLPLVVCTVYNANFQKPGLARCVRVAVALFNDVISRAAREFALPVVELRTICMQPSDYANEIEPSSAGSGKIAAAIAAAFRIDTGPARDCGSP
jgi:hypothetical protein